MVQIVMENIGTKYFLSGKDEKIVKSKDNNIKSFYLGTPSGNFKAIDNHGKEITNRKGLPNVCRVHGNM